MSALPAGRDPELSLIRTRYQTDFHQALRDAFATLSSDQRNVLRLRFAVGLTIEQAAAVLKVNRATVVRWQAAAEKAMLKETQRLLRQRLRVSPAELDSLIRLVRSEFQLSLSDVLPRSASE